ncbi:hypothetical protein N752_29470 [Desulforamulus aquiferis]|nr:tyrosine-type recombinase/integrase [Desulforamulus aquiferis]RYD01708.1 hypothetical protein N752_29470 [Desulforamulus aquiferis]
MKNQILEMFLRDNGHKYKVGTINNYIRAIECFLNFIQCDISNIAQKDIKNWRNFLVKDLKLAPRTVNMYLAAARTLLKYCQEECIIEKVVDVKRLKTSKTLPKPIPYTTLYKLQEAAKGNLRDRTIIETLFCTGVRVSELTKIKIQDIQWENRQIWIRDGKGSYDRFVLFTQKCEELIKQYLKTRKDNKEILFQRNYKGEKFTRHDIRYVLLNYSSSIGERVTPHMFRYTFGCLLYRKGATLQMLAKLLGHKNIDNVKIYQSCLTAKV